MKLQTFALLGLLSVLPACAPRESASYDWVQTELFFGLTRLDHSPISDGEWQNFLNGKVTPRFSAGLTVLPAEGRYYSAEHGLYREPSRVILLMYPKSQAAETNRKIHEIVQAYIREFDQDSVLRADSPQAATLIVREK